MQAGLPGRPNPRPTPPPLVMSILIAGLIGVLVAGAGLKLYAQGPLNPRHESLAVAEKAFQDGKDHAAYIAFTRLAKKGNVAAEYWLAKMAVRGLGVPRNATKAIKWYVKAAQGNFMRADLRLGEIYLYGRLVAPNPSRAIAYLEKAAFHGNPRAAMLLAQVYRIGIGAKRSQTKAYAWFEVAALEGNAFAQRERSTSFHELRLADQKSVITQAKEFLKKIKNNASLLKQEALKKQTVRAPSSHAGMVHIS